MKWRRRERPQSRTDPLPPQPERRPTTSRPPQVTEPGPPVRPIAPEPARLGRPADPLALRVLVVCTANVCRSPLGQVILDHELRTSGVLAIVSSAGTVGAADLAVDERTATWAERYRADLTGHVPRQLTRAVILDDGRDLILGMSRNHVREVLATDMTAMARTFTLKEFLRRAAVAPRQRSETVSEWIQRLGNQRTPADFQGERRSDEIVDPYGRSDETFTASAGEIERCCADIVTAMTTTSGLNRAAQR